MLYTSYQTLRADLLSKKTTCVKVVNNYLAQIEKTKDLNIYLCVFKESALKRAKELDEKLARGETIGKAFGMPVAVKDIISMKGEQLTCASKILEHYKSPYDATVITRLEKEDVIFIGKTNLDEFAMGSSNERSAFGNVKNPLNPEYVPGGSSGGAAAAIAAQTAIISLGTDTGGSVRQPASFCDIIGFKPTYGRISRYGIVAFASSFDQVGIFSATIEDIALTSEIVFGKDENDSTTSSKEVATFSNNISATDISKMTIGVPKEFFADTLDKEIKTLVMNQIEKLKSKGAKVKEISLPHIGYSLATYYVLTNAEASSNLSRFDGVRYGYRSALSKDLNAMYVNSRSEGFGKEVKRRIMLGTYVLSAGYYDAYYKKAQQVRRIIQNEFMNAFKEVDVIVSPTSPCFPFKFGEKTNNPLEMYLADIYTVGVNIAGIPAISAPAGFGKNNLPAGIQFMSKPFSEDVLFAFVKKLSE